jgi:hypothetical protein
VVQDERRQHDPWDDVLANVQGITYPATDGSDSSEEWIKVREILNHLSITPDRATSEIYRRLKGVMRRLGWKTGKHYFGGERQERGYWRPDNG